MRKQMRKAERLKSHQPVRPENFKPFQFPSSRELQKTHSDKMMAIAAELMKKAEQVNRNGKFKPTWESLDTHTCPEWFLDAKFGMFIDWGLYSIPAYAPSGYPDWYLWRMLTDTKDYHEKYWGRDFKPDDFIPLFTAGDFNADHLADVAQAAGMKYVIPFLKHHDGFCLWDCSFTLRTSVRMGPKRDLAEELRDACRKRGLKFGFYYSIDDWFYPIIRDDGELEVRVWNAPDGSDMKTDPYDERTWDRILSGKMPVRDFFNDYINPTAIEFFDRYDPDIFWGDGDWILDAEQRESIKFLAYFYNRAEGRKEVASNDRLGCCRFIPTRGQKETAKAHGDFYGSEGLYKPGQDPEIDLPWEENHGLSHSFGYNWRETDDDVRSAQELLHMIIDVVAAGGNMLLITNLTPAGSLDPLLAERLRLVGSWLQINGEAIYGTRKWRAFKEGEHIRFTMSKDGHYVYAILLKWPEETITLRSLTVKDGSAVRMLGTVEFLEWERRGNEVRIHIPAKLQSQKPCHGAWVIRIDTANVTD